MCRSSGSKQGQHPVRPYGTALTGRNRPSQTLPVFAWRTEELNECQQTANTNPPAPPFVESFAVDIFIPNPILSRRRHCRRACSPARRCKGRFISPINSWRARGCPVCLTSSTCLPVCPPLGSTVHTNPKGWLLRAAPPAASAREPRPSVLRRFPKPAARCCTRDPRLHAQLAGSVSTASTSSDPGPLWTITKPPIGPAPPGRHSRGEGREARSQEPRARSHRRTRRRFCPRAALQLCISRLSPLRRC